jgi:hypothetical protein
LPPRQEGASNRYATSMSQGRNRCLTLCHRDGELHSRVKTIRQKLDRLDEAFLYSESIDLTSYSRQRDKRREELTLAKIERHTEAVEELPGGNRLRRKSVQSNRRNGATFQLLGAESEW